jgi:hypothetical protein
MHEHPTLPLSGASIAQGKPLADQTVQLGSRSTFFAMTLRWISFEPP